MPAEVLLFELEPFAAMRVAQVLLGAGYWTTVASSLFQALEKLNTPGADFQIMVANIADAPPASAELLLASARYRFPKIRLICVSDGGIHSDCPLADVLICDDTADGLLEMMLALRQGRGRASVQGEATQGGSASAPTEEIGATA